MPHKRKPRGGGRRTSPSLSEERLQTNTSPPPVDATQNSDTVLLSGLHFLIIRLKMKAGENGKVWWWFVSYRHTLCSEALH